MAPEEMVQPSDLGEGLRFLLRTSPTCLVREIEFAPPAQREIVERLAALRRRAAAIPTRNRSRKATERYVRGAAWKDLRAEW